MRKLIHSSLSLLLSMVSFLSAGYSQCAFTVSDDTPCGLTIVNFSVNNPGVGYSWDMNGDNIIDAAGSTAFYIYPHTTIPISYTATLYFNGVACATQVLIVQPPPDPTIGVIPGNGILTGNQIRVCSGSPDATLSIFNASLTLANNQSYSINWGDGNIQTLLASEFTASDVVDHDYSGFGYYTISVTTTSIVGCQAVKSYLFYNGSNPSVGMANPGNTVGLCVPATITFPITNTATNPTGTVYNVYISGVLVDNFTQENIPSEYTYTFLETSCGKGTVTGNYENAYDIQIVATNPCGSSQATIEPIELSSPPEPEILLDEPNIVCVDDAITFSNGSTGIGEVVSGNPSTCSTNLSASWSITPGVPGIHWNIINGNVFDSEEIEIEFLIPGDYTVQMTINSQACGAFSASQVLTIIDPPSIGATVALVNASAPATSDECAPTIASFTNLSSGDSLIYEWEINPSTGWQYWNGTDDTTTDLELLILEAGTYNVGLKATNDCKTAWWDTTIVIISTPIIQLDPIPDFCETATLNFDNNNTDLNANGGVFNNFTWSFPGGTPANSNDQFPSNIQYNSPGEYIVTLQASNQCGPVTYRDTFVVVAPGSLVVDNDYTICVSEPSFAISATPNGGTWSGAGVDANGWFTPSPFNIGTHTLIYEFNQGGCSLVDSLRVTLLPLPLVNAGSNQTACIDDPSIIISGGSPVGGTWSVDNGGILLGNNNFDALASGPGLYNLTYTFIDANNCSNTATKTLLINDLPSVEAGPDQTLCNAPADIQLTGFTPTGGTWSGTGVNPIGSFNAMNTPGIGTYQLYYYYTDPSTSCNNIDSLTITVIEAATVDAGPNQSICVDGSPIDLSAQVTPAGGTWFANGSDGLFGNVFNPSVAGVGTHLLTYTYGQGTCANSDNIQITVFALPNVNAGKDNEICVTETSFLLTGTPVGGTWTANNGGQLNGNDFSPSASGEGTFTFTYSYTNANGCTHSDEKEIIVHPLPVLNSNDTLYCNTPGLVDLPFSTPTGGTWSGTGVNNNRFDPQVAGGTGIYTLVYEYTNSNGCTNSISANIEVIEPTPVMAGTDQELCIDQLPFDLNSGATPSGGIWSSNSTGLNGSTFDPALAGAGTHLLNYSYGTGNCETIDQVEITVHPLPNVHAGQDQAVCISSTSLLLTGTPTGGTWTANSGGQLNGNEFSPNASGAGDYSFTYTYTNANGCTKSDEVNITVNPLPLLQTNDTTYCNTPGLIALPFTSPSGGSWTGNGVVNQMFDPQAAGGAGFYTIVYDYTDPNGCTNSIQSNIQVVMPNPLSAGNDRTLCMDEGIIDLSLNAFPAGGNWFTNATNGLNGTLFDPVQAGTGTHLVIYSQGTGNCEVRDSLWITIYPIPVVHAGNDLNVCFGTEAFVLQGSSPQGGTWTGNGLSDPSAGIFDPSSVAPGDYTLTYAFTNTFGCYREATRVITVFPMEEPAFDLPALACRNAPVTIVNHSPSDYNSSWNFGDGENSAAFAPTHSFTNTGVYNVLLTVENQFGCTDTISHPITITDLPVAYFVPDTIEACTGLDVHLNNQSVGEGLTYFWDFGNGQTSTAPNPDIFFLDPGVNDTTYVISLTITNLCGSSVYEDLIIVHPEPKAAMGIAPQTECSPLIIDFANSSIGGITEYYWDFGNGQTSTDPLPEPQTYTTDTTTTIYTAMLIAKNVCGSDTVYKDIVVEPADVQAFFEVSDDAGCAPHEVTFSNFSSTGAVIEWDFGDGNTSAITQPTHVFEEPGIYQVIQYAHSECGYDTATVAIEVIAPPVVEFTHVTYVCQGQPVTFANGSVNISGNLWDFGDGDTSMLSEPTHIFDSLGTYTVSLTGYSSFNQCPATYTSEVQVMGLPNASFDVPVTFGCAPLAIQFENNSEGIEFYQWDFGDGNTSINENPMHVFSDSGNYEVKLMVTDANGCYNDTSILNILVNPVPTAHFAYEKEQVCGLPADIYFENLSEGASGFEWTFGDSSQSVFNDPTHTYQESGDFAIQMIATNQYGCKDTTADAFTIYPSPVAEFSILSQEGCSPLDVQFENSSTQANAYHWDFGDGNTSDEATPTHLFEEAGSYDVRLTVNVDETCFDTLELSNLVNVYPTPTANFEPVERISDGRKTGEYDFINHSENADFYFWDFGDGATSEEEEPGHRYYNNAARQIYLETTTAYGCVADTLINLYPEFIKGLFVPNGFSPEQGIGDVRLFRPRGVGLKEYHIRVFSTYGQLLWESKALEDGQPSESWNGMYNGKLLPQDVYVWRASAIFEDGTVWRGQETKKGKFQVMGSVILLR